MAETTYFPRRLIRAGAMISGVLLALAVHMLGARYGLDLKTKIDRTSSAPITA